MEKTGFANAIVGTASIKIELNSNGNIAVNGDTVGGSKRISFNNIAANASKSQAEAVADIFLKTLPGTNASGDYDNSETTFSVKWGVA